MEKSQFLSKIKSKKTLEIIGPMSIDTINLHNDIPRVYVDGGLIHRKEDQSITISIGDGDSNDSNHQIDIELNTEKNFSDLDAALMLIPDNITEIVFKGFTGGRLDHHLINFGSIHHFLKNNKTKRTCFIDDKIRAFSGGKQIFQQSGTFSLMSLEKQRIKVYGDCVYELKQDTMLEVLSSMALSNIGNGEVHIESELPLFIYLD